MTSVKRVAVPVAVLAGTLAELLTGCGTGGSSTGTATVATTPAAASPTPSVVVSVSVAPASVQPAPPSASVTLAVSASASVSATAVPVVYFAEDGGDVNAPGAAYAPKCTAGCGLSGDGTTELYDMTWSAWNGTHAVGTGTEKIDDCMPNCAGGTGHSVAVAVTFSKPVQVCVGGVAKSYWTHIVFAWPKGLPPVLSGANAPLNPVDYDNITPSTC